MVLFREIKAVVYDHPRPFLAAVLLAILLAPRVAHLAGPIDEPHSWRQCDTANYALAFHQEGINLLRPSVCWMGGYKTLVMEFPLPEALMAWMYNSFGCHLYLARLVTLLFFAGSALYLYLIVRHALYERLALIATSVYVVLPLSLFYSRAVHVDFFAVFFSHAMTYHLLRASERTSYGHGMAGLIAGTLAFLIKAPYAVYFALPLLALAVGRQGFRRVLFLAIGLGVPVLAFLAWRGYAEAINGAAPEWGFIPGYIKFVKMSGWYYGPPAMRFDLSVWGTLLARLKSDVAAGAGFWLLVGGVSLSFAALLKNRSRGDLFLVSWLLGVLLYVAIFLNLNFIHDYYQIPLLAIGSIFIGIAIELPIRLFRHRGVRFAWIVSLLLYALTALNSFTYAEGNYFKLDTIRIEAGRIIDRHTPTGALIIAAPDIQTDCRDPRLLYRAKRNGWSIYKKELSSGLVATLQGVGARYLVVVSQDEDVGEVYGYRADSYPLGEKPWKVFIAAL